MNLKMTEVGIDHPSPATYLKRKSKIRRILLIASFVSAISFLLALRATKSITWALSQYFGPFGNVIEIDTRLLSGEGLGGMISTLKPVLMLANWTGASIAGRSIRSPHGYYTAQYFRISQPYPKALRRRVCRGINVTAILRDISKQCTGYNHTLLKQLFKTQLCNTLLVREMPTHSRNCLHATAPLVRALVKFRSGDPLHTRKTDVCVLRRGGDVEQKIRQGRGNMWAIDEEIGLPLIREAQKRGARIVISTQTKHKHELLSRFMPDVFSNFDTLETVVSKLSNCRCLFIAAASSFAASLVPILRPTYIVYSQNRTGFEFNVKPYRFDEFGEHAIPIQAPEDIIIEKCAPQLDER